MSRRHIWRVGKWLPEDDQVLHDWLKKLVDRVTADPPVLAPVIQEFKELIEGDAQAYMLFSQMFNEVPTTLKVVNDYNTMLQCFNVIITQAPTFDETELVGFPIYAVLDMVMGTPSGYFAFLNDKVNAQFRKMLNNWAGFLSSPESASVLTTGWLSLPNFAVTYICNPMLPHYGFASWDEYFTREFRPNVRPLTAPTDDDVIANACEAAPYCCATNVKALDSFWIKGQHYSLNHMLAGDALAPQFVGGTVYQAFLSALSYHRWHSPVNGMVSKIVLQSGTYYSENPAEAMAPNWSQGYMTSLATRGIIFIQADNPKIGLMCFIAVGMAEVSTCQVTVAVGQRVSKGEQLGMFHYGGSTHCLLFRPGVSLTFNFHGETPGLSAENILVNLDIATVD